MNKILIFGLLGLAAYSYFKKSNNPEEQEIQRVIALIKADAAWLESVRLKALERGISLDEMLRIDAMWMIEQGW